MGHIAGTNNYSTVSVVAYLVCGVLWLCDRRASSRVVLRVDVGVCGGGRTRRPEILRQGINALKFVESDTHFTRTR